MDLSTIKIVLVHPIKGGNIGAVCRVMKNMGLKELVLVSPAQFDLREAKMMACHSEDILSAAKYCASLEEAVHDCSLILGTSAREGFYRQDALSPRELASKITQLPSSVKVALVFGSEDSGLTNEQLAVCNEVVRIPTAPEHSSLNLSHAVLLCCYELFLAGINVSVPISTTEANLSRQRDGKIGTDTFIPARSAVREEFFRAWEGIMKESEFIGELNRDHMMLRFRKIFSRLEADDEDFGILIGIARQVGWRFGRGKG